MLPVQIIQEHISRAYIRAVCARAGCIVDEPAPDFGVDLWLRYLTVTSRGERRDLGHKIGIQAKATTRARISTGTVTYDLDAKAHRDLTSRRGLPRILVLYVMPDDEHEWLGTTEDALVLRRCAYWDYLRGQDTTENDASVRISMPRGKRFDVEAVSGPLRRLATTRRLP